MHLLILPMILLGLRAPGIPATAAETEFPFAAGTDSTGRAQALSNSSGRVMIESPEFPRGLWVNLVDEAGRRLADIQVEFRSHPDSLVAIRCVDPAGLREEALFWSRPEGNRLRLALKPPDADLPDGLASLYWRIDLTEDLRPSGSSFTGWEEMTDFLHRQRRRGTEQVAVQVDSSTALVVDLTDAEPVERRVEYLEDRARMSLGTVDPSLVEILLSPKRNRALFEGAIVLTDFILVPDSDLEKWVLRWRKSRWGPVAWSEVAGLTRFHVGTDDNDVVDVSPLAALTNLEDLSLAINQVVDLSPLAGLTNLKILRLHDNQIVDVGPLAGLTNLEKLELARNKIVDVSPLATLTKLERLGLHNNKIVDISPLVALTNLKSLVLNHNQIADLSPLTELNYLEMLALSGNKIVDVGSLSALTYLLKSLYLNNNDIVDVSPLSALTTLRRLVLNNNKIVDVSPLANLTNLEDLWIIDNEIADVSPLALTNLESLTLCFNKIVNVSPLAPMTSLQALDLSDNNKIDLNSVATLTNLSWLGLRSSEIVDISSLASLTNLGGLNLNDNEIVDISPLAALTRLEWLGLDGNQIVDLSPLADLTNLDRLRLNSNQIQDISALVANPGLDGSNGWVLLRDNPLSDLAINEQIPALRARGVDVHY